MWNNEATIRQFEERVRQFACAHSLFVAGRKYIVALSGGADSVALLLALKSLGIAMEAAHCNFRLRGGESQRDEDFCIALCDRMGIPLHRIHFDTRPYAALHKESIEMAARHLRYAYFSSLMKDIGAEGVCVAHHRDDSVETVLINLVRGTGINGLKGIAAKNNGIIRPLLCVGRSDITDYLSARQQPFVTDSTNLIDDVVRNKIRLDVLPLLEEINPSVKRCIFETSLRVGEALKAYNASIAASIKEVMPEDGSISIELLQRQTAPQEVLFSILKEKGFSSAQTGQIFSALGKGRTGSLWTSSSHRLLIDRGRILMESIGSGRTAPLRIPETGVYVYDDSLTLEVSILPVGEGFIVSKAAHSVCVDRARTVFPLTLRPWKNGDRFVPFGMKHSRLVSDFLTDRKRSLFHKQRQLVVEDAEGRIVWLVGERIDHRFRITPSTGVALRLSLRG